MADTVLDCGMPLVSRRGVALVFAQPSTVQVMEPRDADAVQRLRARIAEASVTLDVAVECEIAEGVAAGVGEMPSLRCRTPDGSVAVEFYVEDDEYTWVELRTRDWRSSELAELRSDWLASDEGLRWIGDLIAEKWTVARRFRLLGPRRLHVFGGGPSLKVESSARIRDSEVEDLDGAVWELSEGDAVVGYVSCQVGKSWFPRPGRPWPWLAVVWNDGTKEPSVDEEPPWTYVAELRSGRFDWMDGREMDRRRVYDARLLDADEGRLVRARFTITDADF